MGGNVKVSFKKFLKEGGNVKVGEVQAQQIDLTKVERKDIVKDIMSSLLTLNKTFDKKYGIPIWSKENFITSGKVFSGSSEHFVNLEISDEEFLKAKPQVGDIDVQMDKRLEPQLNEILVKGTRFGEMTYVGRSDTAVGQISGLFKIFNGKLDLDLYIQVDFEFVEVDKLGLPTAWEKFAHSSSWDDIQAGIKGVFHKFLFGSIDFAVQKEVIILKGKKKNPKKMMVHDLAFSVGKGLRQKYVRASDENGKAIVIQKLPAFEEIPSKGAKYINDLKIMFEMLFRRPPTKKDLTDINSFVGLVSLIKKNFKSGEQKLIYDEFITRIWGKGAQKLYRGSPEMDLKAKHPAAEKIAKEFGKKINNDMMISYYDKY